MQTESLFQRDSAHTNSLPGRHTHAHARTHTNSLKGPSNLPSIWEKEKSRTFLPALFPHCCPLLLSAVSNCWMCVVHVCLCVCVRVCKCKSGGGSVELFDDLTPLAATQSTCPTMRQEGGSGTKPWMRLHLPELFTHLFSFCCWPLLHYCASSCSAGFRWQESQPKEPLFLPLCHPTPLRFPTMLSPFLAWHNLKWYLSEFISSPVN